MYICYVLGFVLSGAREAIKLKPNTVRADTELQHAKDQEILKLGQDDHARPLKESEVERVGSRAAAKTGAQCPCQGVDLLGLSPANRFALTFAWGLPFSCPHLCLLFFPFTLRYSKELCNFSFPLFATYGPNLRSKN